MAGTLTISTLSDGTNSTSSTNCIQGSAKAWINYKGTSTQSVRASYNVSSVTVNGTGDYTINFTNAMPSNYAGVCMTNDDASTTNYNVLASNWSTPTTTAFRVVCAKTSSNSLYSPLYLYVAFFG